MFKLYLLGIAENVLTKQQQRILSCCPVIVGTKRFKPMVDQITAEFIEISPLAGAFSKIRNCLQKNNVAVLASGDPLFYGIGRKLQAEFAHEEIEIYPALSSIQRACALFGLSWDDAVITSLHGRTTEHIPGRLLNNSKNLVLTDAHNRPDHIARSIIDYLHLIGGDQLLQDTKMLVAEDIGLDSEAVFSGSLLDGSKQAFSDLNVLCLLVPRSRKISTFGFDFGLTEDDIQHSRGLITKNEVRAATLHQLQLPPRGILWDIGGGSGSLSLEAARSNPGLTVYTVEHKREEIDNIKKNIVKFGCYNIVPVFGRAPAVLNTLPTPDRVFIGGSSGSLPQILSLLDNQLAKHGRLVVNGVIEKTIKQTPELMRKHGFKVTSSVIQVSRTDSEGKSLSFNPITIMTGRR